MFLIIISQLQTNEWGKYFNEIREACTGYKKDIDSLIKEYDGYYDIKVFNWDGSTTTPLTKEQEIELFEEKKYPDVECTQEVCDHPNCNHPNNEDFEADIEAANHYRE